MYIAFFGKSQSFEFHAFDEEGIVNDFDSVIKDFELLESKWFTIDSTNNNTILSRYEFASNNKKYCLLKLYGFAQASGGVRVEGSTYGVAFLSQEPLLLSVNNVKLLTLLLKYFSDLCLTNSKFKKPDFKEDSYSIWKAFANQIGYSKIEKGKYLSTLDNNIPIAFLLTDFEQVPVISESLLSKSSMLYFSTDIDHLKRTRERWDKKFQFYLVNQQGTTLYSDPKVNANTDKAKIINPLEDQEISNYDIRLVELEKELINTRNNHKKVNIRYKKLILLISVVTFVFIVLYFSTFFKNEKQNIAITQPVVNSNNKINFSKIIADSVMLDTSRSHAAVEFFNSYLLYKKNNSEDSSEKKKKLLNNMLATGRKFKIDSLILIETIKKTIK